VIISDSTTPIILLDLDRVDLLSNLFPKVLIPKAVYHEVTAKYHKMLPTFISVQTVASSEVLETLKLLLDDGESEAIALAISLQSPLIIDEKKGRKIAKQEGVKIIGLLGILYLNIKKGYISIEDARLFLDDAISHGYRISTNLIEQMLAKIGSKIAF